jgi:ABC-type nitrate/sulfonate/bicarbonate transport system substrate-binding protein
MVEEEAAVQRQRVALICVGLLLLGIVGACAPASAPGGTAAGTAASAPAAGTVPAQPPAQVRMSYAGLTAHFATSWVAKDAGLFEKYGIDAELLHLPSRQASAALVSGEVDYGFFSGRTIVELQLQGSDIVAVAGPLLKLIQSVIVQPDIRAPTDLRGKRVAVTGFGSINDFAARYLLKQWGVRPDEEVTLLQLQTIPNIFAALESRAVEGGVLSPPTSFQAMSMGYRELGAMHDQPFEYPASLVVVRANTLRERPDQVRRVVRAVTEAIARIKNDRATAEATFGSYTGVGDAESLRLTYDLYAPAFERLPLLTESAMQAAIDEVGSEEPRAREIAVSGTMDMRFVRELEAAGLMRELYP